jgi:hypothetical protein
MTIVGKILVFVNLLFSLVVGWFAVMSYAARTHWVDAFNKQQAVAQVADANARQYLQEKLKAEADVAEWQKKLGDQEKVLKAEVKRAKDETTAARAEADTQKGLAATADAQAKQAQADAGRRQLEVATLEKNLRAEIDRAHALVDTANKSREKQVASEIEAESHRARAEQLQKELARAETQLADIRKSGGGQGSRTLAADNPPPENVEGLVKTADASGLLRLTIGSDAGLAKGHTLVVYRINPSAPLQSKYLGRVRVLDVNAHEAVAQPVGRMLDKPQAGDRVASRI